MLLRWPNEAEEMCSAYFKNVIAYKILLGEDSLQEFTCESRVWMVELY
jgi:hypothetical protein